jgi:hypothetical protein
MGDEGWRYCAGLPCTVIGI